MISTLLNNNTNNSFKFSIKACRSFLNLKLVQKSIFATNNSSRFSTLEKKKTLTELIKTKKPLYEDIKTIPNLICLLRISCSPILGYCIINGYYDYSLGLFVVCGLTDALDGYIARNFNQRTYLGSLLDPFSDKVLVGVMTLSLAWSSLLPWPLALVIISRDALLILASAIYRYKSISKPRTFAKYFDFSLASTQVKPSNIGKFNTFLQLSLFATTLAYPVFNIQNTLFLWVLQYLTGFTTLLTGIDYFFLRRAIQKIK